MMVSLLERIGMHWSLQVPQEFDSNTRSPSLKGVGDAAQDFDSQKALSETRPAGRRTEVLGDPPVVRSPKRFVEKSVLKVNVGKIENGPRQVLLSHCLITNASGQCF